MSDLDGVGPHDDGPRGVGPHDDALRGVGPHAGGLCGVQTHGVPTWRVTLVARAVDQDDDVAEVALEQEARTFGVRLRFEDGSMRATFAVSGETLEDATVTAIEHWADMGADVGLPEWPLARLTVEQVKDPLEEGGVAAHRRRPPFGRPDSSIALDAPAPVSVRPLLRLVH